MIPQSIHQLGIAAVFTFIIIGLCYEVLAYLHTALSNVMKRPRKIPTTRKRRVGTLHLDQPSDLDHVHQSGCFLRYASSLWRTWEAYSTGATLYRVKDTDQGLRGSIWMWMPRNVTPARASQAWVQRNVPPAHVVQASAVLQEVRRHRSAAPVGAAQYARRLQAACEQAQTIVACFEDHCSGAEHQLHPLPLIRGRGWDRACRVAQGMDCFTSQQPLGDADRLPPPPILLWTSEPDSRAAPRSHGPGEACERFLMTLALCTRASLARHRPRVKRTRHGQSLRHKMKEMRSQTQEFDSDEDFVRLVDALAEDVGENFEDYFSAEFTGWTG